MTVRHRGQFFPVIRHLIIAGSHSSSASPQPPLRAPQPLHPRSTRLPETPSQKLAIAKLTARLDEKLNQDVASQLDEKNASQGFVARLEKRLEDEHKQLLQQEAQRKELLKDSRISPAMQQRMENFLDTRNNMRDREALLEEAFQEGYWENTKEMVRLGEKLWDAAKTAIPVVDANPFPNWDGIDLNNKLTNVSTILEGKVALVSFMMTALAEKHVKSYIEPFKQEFRQDSRVKTVMINVEENALRGTAVKWLVVPFIRWRTPKTEQCNYMLHFGPVDRKSVASTRAS
ncbi:hypothetical protein SeMB42_g01071 [Synchytrium endobioticum]|nr:hypothetical protein SeMB42_g01071 [Synchytrium endobioticum]